VKHVTSQWSLLAVLIVSAFALCSSAETQPKKFSRVGYVTSNSSAAISTRTEAFRQGLRELGYVEGKNIVIELNGDPPKANWIACQCSRLNWCGLIPT